MKRFLIVSSLSLSLLTATHDLQAQDGPPDPAHGDVARQDATQGKPQGQDVQKQDVSKDSKDQSKDQGADGNKQNANPYAAAYYGLYGTQNANGNTSQEPGVYDPYGNTTTSDPYGTIYSQQNNNPYDAATLNYLLRAYNPQQSDASQTAALQYLLNGYYNLYQNEKKPEEGEQDASGNSVYPNQYIPHAANVYSQYANGIYNPANVQGYLPADVFQNYYQSDPANAYQFLLDQQSGNVSKYWLGLQTGPLPKDVRPFLNLPEDQGVVVMSVVDDSPAADAGLQKNDIILSLGGKPVKQVSDLYKIVGEIEDGKAEMEIVRQGEAMTLKIQAQVRPEPKQQAANPDLGNIIYSPYKYVPQPYSPYLANGQDPRVEALQNQVKELTERLEKLEAKINK